MPKLPRLVIASVSEHEEASTSTVAIMAALQSRGYHVQHFRSLAAFTPIDYVTPLTGIASRHLDPWIMSVPLCRELFAQSAAHADVSVIEGNMSVPAGSSADGDAGGWRLLAKSLNAPVVGVIRSQSADLFHAKAMPPGIDALFIDGFESRDSYESEKTTVEGIHGIPVLGGLAGGNLAAECIEKMRQARRIPGAMVSELARQVLEVTNFERVLKLAHSRPFPNQPAELFSPSRSPRSLRVAIAYDDCFHCYFPDTLDALEFLGAELSEFSPLVDERLPEGTDIVYLGCGHPHHHARRLSENECMRAALREHVCSGRRVYAEGGGTAYLCHKLRLEDDSLVPMVGIFAAEAKFTGRPLDRPVPVTLTCERANWIAGASETIRGYRNAAWQLFPGRGLTPCFSSDSPDPECVVRHHCIGSTIHLNFAAQPRVLQAFFAPHAPSLSL
jgi:cobyrinic acid a,c-diamide synthase